MIAGEIRWLVNEVTEIMDGSGGACLPGPSDFCIMRDRPGCRRVASLKLIDQYSPPVHPHMPNYVTPQMRTPIRQILLKWTGRGGKTSLLKSDAPFRWRGNRSFGPFLGDRTMGIRWGREGVNRWQL